MENGKENYTKDRKCLNKKDWLSVRAQPTATNNAKEFHKKIKYILKYQIEYTCWHSFKWDVFFNVDYSEKKRE